MTKKQKYSESDIEVLTDVEHVRKRVSIYLGSNNPATYYLPIFNDGKLDVLPQTFGPATYKCVNEVIDNIVDEYSQHKPKKPTIIIEADANNGKYTITDVGRGVPIGKHESGKPTPEVVFGSLRSGRNFSDDREIGVIGQNGMGVSLTKVCSKEFSIEIHRDAKKYTQRFTTEKTSKPIITKCKKSKTGTQVSFTLDDDVFKNISLPNILMKSRAMEVAFTNPGTEVIYNKERFIYKNGLESLISEISKDYFKFENNNITFFVIFDAHQGIDERIFTYVNSSFLFDGGICNTQFLNAFFNKSLSQLKPAAKKHKCDVTKNDVRQNLLVFGVIKTKNPEYDSQSKTRLTGPSLRKDMDELLDASWAKFTRNNKKWLEEVIQRAAARHNTNANKQAIKELSKHSRKKIAGLVDATDKNRFNCQLLITEGKSAAASITDVRDPQKTAIYPLTGKINNVYGMSVAQILKAGKVTDLLMAIGLIPGKPCMRSDLKYGKVIIATDADVDGADIFTLLVNLFYQFWPELFSEAYKEPFIYRLIAPNIVAVKGKKRVHFVDTASYEAVKHKYSGYTINYLKGLGSMEKVDFVEILSSDEYLIPIIDDGSLEDSLKLLFSTDANARKEWLKK